MTARLGLGLIGIGRPWPDDSSAVASPGQARTLLATARLLGIDFLDTAPAYGGSKAALGQIMQEQGESIPPAAVIATKCGEYWSPDRGSWTDHRPESVEASVRQSLAGLGRIDLMQVHKATAEVLAEPALLRVLQRLAAELGIAHLGAA
jgi:aryl-alcohol dehydrogenase-like predicted oxidoreductase